MPKLIYKLIARHYTRGQRKSGLQAAFYYVSKPLKLGVIRHLFQNTWNARACGKRTAA
jgi:hypothetical protein